MINASRRPNLSVIHAYLSPGATMCGEPGLDNRGGGIADCQECRDRLMSAVARQLIDEGFPHCQPPRYLIPQKETR
jgi:hypothetical protein